MEYRNGSPAFGLDTQILALQIFREAFGVAADPERFPFAWREALSEARAVNEEEQQ
jgi:hypothetical protein